MFDSNMDIVGKHATYLKFISKKAGELNKDAKIAPIFNRYLDVYMAAAIIGAVKNIRANKDTTSSDSAKLLAEQVIKENKRLKLLYRMVLVTDTSSGMNEEERVDFVFRSTKNEDIAKGMAIFESYVRGGIEWLYETITDGATSEDQYLENLYKLINEYNNLYHEDASASIGELF